MPLPEARAAGGAAFDGKRIVYAGGVKPGGVASEVFAFAPGDGAWDARRSPARRPASTWPSRPDGAGETFVLGGRVGGLDKTSAIVDLIEGTGDVHDDRRAADEARRRRRRSGGRRSAPAWPAASHPAARTRRSSAWPPTAPSHAAGSRRRASRGRCRRSIDGAAYVVLGGRQPGLFASDVTETITLP